MLKQIPIVPNGKRYWVLSDKAEDAEVKVGEFTLSENGGKKKPPLQGRIVAVGDAKEIIQAPIDKVTGLPRLGATTYEALTCKYKFQDLVIFGAYAGNEHTHDGVKYTILHEDEILGLVIEKPFDERDTTDLTKG